MSRIFFLLTFHVFYSFAFGAVSGHLEKLKSKFPYGLLGDDYGILTMDDLAINVCEAYPRPFSPSSQAYQYWQCFEEKNISFDCEDNGVSDEGAMGLIVVSAATDHGQQDFIERRLWPMRDCKRFIGDAAKLLKGVRYTCISASFIDTKSDGSGHQTMNWIFERIKTKKGCEGHGCDFAKEFKRDNCPNLKF